MDPLTLAFLASTAISGAGALMGAKSSSKASASNAQMDMLNYQQRERERQQGLQLAERARQDALTESARTREEAERLRQEQLNRHRLGVTNASGSRVYWDPQRGWVTTLAGIDEAEQGARFRERGFADKLMDELSTIQRVDPERLRQLLYHRATSGLSEAFRENLSEGLRGATRTDNPRLAAALLEQNNKQLGKAFSDAAIEAELRAPELAEARYHNPRKNITELYQAFSDRAGKQPTINAYLPQFTNEDSKFGLAGLQAGLEGGKLAGTFGLSGINLKGGSLSPQPADMGLANAFASIGQLGGSITNKFQTDQKYNDALDLAYQKYGMNRRRDTVYG